ncbi:histidine kinase [Paenibacillus alvei TS-15]|uniref:histidine kinase n=1 Tax=Paenibacillus alvei TS-15 TaxID=1117108 RepID=S9SNP3_PAEAL|nr:ATP-binding protein [Paenibacillus alvei]EPY07397.1 histidine kinase [Paenibacillus alvei TS-15]
MKNVRAKHQYFVYLSLFLFLFAAFYIHGQSFQYPYIGVQLENHNDKWFVAGIEPGGKAEEIGIAPGDELLALDGKRLTDWQHSKIIDMKQVKTYTFLHHGTEIQGKVDQRDFFKQIFAIGVELILVGIGSFTYFRKPESHMIRKFFKMNIVLAFIILTIYATELIIANVILAACSIWIPYLMLDMFLQLIFTKVRPVVQNLFTCAKVVLAVFTLFTSLTITIGKIPDWIRDITLIQFMLAIGAILILGRRNWRHFDRIRKNYLLILVTGISLSFLPFLFLYAIPNLVGLKYILAPEYALMGLIPFSSTIMYILIKQRMVDMQLYISRLYIHTLFVAGLFFVYLCSFTFRWSPLIYIFFIVAYTGSYQWALKWANGKVNGRKQWLEKEKLKLSIQLAEKKNNRDLIVMLVEMIQEVIDVEGICVLWRDGVQQHAYCVGIFEELEEKLLMEDCSELVLRQKYNFSEVLKIGETNYLCLGHKSNNTFFSAEELQFLEKIHMEVFRLLRNAQLLSNMQKVYMSSKVQDGDNTKEAANPNNEMNYLLLEAQESERIQTSYFLHDQILQNLIFLSRDLEELYDSKVINKQKVKLWLHCVYDSQNEIRLLCDRLHPHIVDKTDLKEALQWLIRSTKERAELEIEFQYRLSSDLVLQPLVKTNVFRIIRELLTNAVKHANASKVTLSIWNSGRVLQCKVQDNGTGFDVTELGQKNSDQRHFGLVSIHHQVNYLGGSMNIHSSIGAGVEVHICVPVMEEHSHVG